jgi:hypothetical protein
MHALAADPYYSSNSALVSILIFWLTSVWALINIPAYRE